MHFIGVLNTKGGVGKTTLVSCLAVRAAQDSKVAVCDLDPQSSLSDWYVRRGSPPNPNLLTNADLASDAAESLRLTSHYDYILFDGPPGALMVTEDAVETCDFVVIPIRASGFDLGASRDCIQICQDLSTPYLVVINDATRSDAKLVEAARSTLLSWNVPLAKTSVSHRVAYVSAVITGTTGAERDTKGAGQEIDLLWKEIKAAVRKAVKGKAA